MAEVEHRHVLVVPWSAEGHVNGMFSLALLLAAQKGLLVSFGYPALAHGLALKRDKLTHLPHTLRVLVVEDGLPSPEQEAPKLPHFIKSSSVIVHALEALLHPAMGASSPSLPLERSSAALDVANEIPPWPPICCIISDTFVPQTHGLAQSLGIPRVDFWTGNATVFNIFLHVPQLLAKGVLPLSKGAGEEWKGEASLIDFIAGLPPCRVTQLPYNLLQPYDALQPLVEFLTESFSPAKYADRILVHSVYELEKHVFDTLQAQGFPIYAVGPFLESKSDSVATITNTNESLDWLNRQMPASVVYVAFGTVTRLSLREIQSMARGLEASGHPFFWVVPNDSIDSNESFLKDLVERTVSQGKGFIVPWAPQTEVLKSSAVGAFISHCGWNSVLESLWEGVPIVTCSQAAEQNCNAKSVVEDWKVGVEMRREDDGSFTAEAVREAIEEIMGNSGVKERALHFKHVVRDNVGPQGTSHSNLASFIDRLLHLPVAKDGLES